jgi:hypothetical protein
MRERLRWTIGSARMLRGMFRRTMGAYRMITRWQLDDIGIEHSQYFQGYSSGSYAESSYGIGNNPREALDDCLEQIASAGQDTAELERAIFALYPAFADDSANESASVIEYLRANCPEAFDESGELADDSGELYYRIGIRFDTREPSASDCQNLDGSWPEELEALASDCDTIPALANYARTKAQAMRKRASGAILEALKLERECERIYQRLPEPLKW